MTPKEIAGGLSELGCKPTGSRYLCVATEDSDWDYYVIETNQVLDWLRSNGFTTECEKLYDELGFRSWRHSSWPVNVLTMTDDYFAAYDYANDRVKACGEDLSTREKRVDKFKHFLAVYGSLVTAPNDLVPHPENGFDIDLDGLAVRRELEGEDA